VFTAISDTGEVLDQESCEKRFYLQANAQRLQQDIRKTETEQRRQRQEIFAVEGGLEARRDALIAALQKRLHRASRNQSLFVVRWSVIQCS
jgi:hypothetical protein